VSHDITGFQRYRRPDGEPSQENHNPDPGLNTRETNIEKHRAMVPPHSLAADEPSEALNVMEVSDKEFRDKMPKASVGIEGGEVTGVQPKRDRHMAENPEKYDAESYAPPTSVNPGTSGTGPKDAEEGKKQSDEGYKKELEAAYDPALKAGQQEFSKRLSKERLAMGGNPEEPAGGEGDGGDFVETKSGDAVPASKEDELPDGAVAGDYSADAPERPIEKPELEPIPEDVPPENPLQPEVTPAEQPEEEPEEKPEPVEKGPSKLEGMTKQELVDYAQERHGTILENSMKKDAMIQEIEKMEAKA
jgi:hypothetical protein